MSTLSRATGTTRARHRNDYYPTIDPRAAAALAPFEALCRDIVSVGRLKWFENSDHDATDDCAWYLFDAAKDPAEPVRYHFRRTAERAQLSLI